MARHHQLRLSVRQAGGLRASGASDLTFLAGGLALLSAMLLAAIVLWLGVPVLWLYVASLVQGETGSVGAAMLTAFTGVAMSIPVLVLLLGALSARYRALAITHRDADPGSGPLETVMVSSAGLAVVGIAIWFVGFSHSAPMPVPGGY